MTEPAGVTQLKIYNDSYRVGKPLVPDAVYNELYRQEKSRYPEHMFFTNVQPEVIKNAVTLPYQMGSLSNYDKISVLKWVSKFPCDEGYVASFKLDGVSMTLVYEYATLILGASRGEGDIGQNMTSKAAEFAPTITKKERVVVRGECLLNCDPESIGYKNRRNAVGGILNRDDLDRLKYIRFVAFELLECVDMATTEIGRFTQMAEMGLDVVPFVHIPKNYIAKIPIILENMIKKFQGNAKREYDIDGAVVAPCDYVFEDSAYPKKKIAYKKEEEVFVSTVTKVLWDVSRLGRLIPVVCYKPIDINGATFSKATGHHASLIALNDIKTGQTIKICRAKEVIPMVVVDEVKPAPNYKLLPMECPSCKKSVTWNANRVHLLCTFDDCPEMMFKKITHFFVCLGLKGFTLSSFKSLTIRSVKRACEITKEEILEIPGWGESSAQQFVDGIKSVRTTTMVKFLTSLGIDSIGKSISELIAPLTEYDISKICHHTGWNLQEFDLIGEIRSSQIYNGLLANKLFISDCANYITIVMPEIKSSVLEGKRFCITGKLSAPRKEIEEKIKAHGGMAASVKKPGKKAIDQYLICNSASTSDKYVKAVTWDIPIITEAQLDEMIGE